MMDDDVLQLVSRAMRAQAAVNDLSVRKPCPFCGGTDQEVVPVEVQVEQEDGSHQPQHWFAALCSCMANSTASATEAGAWLIWNTRA